MPLYTLLTIACRNCGINIKGRKESKSEVEMQDDESLIMLLFLRPRITESIVRFLVSTSGGIGAWVSLLSA